MQYNTAPNPPVGLNAFGDWFTEVFRLWGAQWQVWVLQGLIYFATIVIPILLGYIPLTISSIVRQGVPDPFSSAVTILLFLLGIISSFCLLPGMVVTALKQIRGQQISAGDIFSGMRFGWGYFVVSFLTGLGVLGCFVGAYALMGLFYLALPLMIDKKMSTSEAIAVSWDTTKQNFWLFVLFAFLSAMLSGMGTVACYIGVIATLPFHAIATAVAYERTFHPYSNVFVTPGATHNPVPPPYTPTPEPTPEPPPPPPTED